MDNATWALARMNMFLHDHPTAEIWRGNTLSNPHWGEPDGLKRFDFAVANPPFSYKSWLNGVNVADDEFGRFGVRHTPGPQRGLRLPAAHPQIAQEYGQSGRYFAPRRSFRGNTEADIRRNLVRQGYDQGVIGLPPNLFYGTGIPACIIVLDKAGAANGTGIFMIDASRGFVKDGNKNRLRAGTFTRL
jgi:type I restriction enzyme M protein